MSVNCVAGERGFSLVEVMVSLMIFMLVSMGLLPLLVSSMHANRGNRLYAQARHLAEEAMAGLQVVDYSRLALAAEESFFIGDLEVQQEVEENVPASDQSRITVTAYWRQQGQSKRYRLQTIRSAP